MSTLHTCESVLSILQRHGITADARQRSLLADYTARLLAWNGKINLISRKDEEHVWRNHILHSLSALMMTELADCSTITDIGSGGGLPGIPLAIMLPDTEFVLVDSIGKKVRAVEDMARGLGLDNVRTLHGRVEDDAVLRSVGRKADAVTARAVTRLEALVRWSASLLRKEGARTLVVWKGGDLAEEIREARRNPIVSGIREMPIDLAEEPMFAAEEKKLVQVRYR